ncbi:MAG: pilus assembly protein TadG-related protein [Alphaproteobacteria bacterium]
MKNLALHRAREQGNALLTTALAIVLLVAVGGAAIDLGRQQLLHSRLQQSSDAAALAGALAPTGSTPSDTANRYFALNYAINDSQSYMGSTTTPTISTDNGVKVSANGAVHNQFISTLGTTSSQVAGATTVSSADSNQTGYAVMVVAGIADSMVKTDVGTDDSMPPDASTLGYSPEQDCQWQWSEYYYHTGPSDPQVVNDCQNLYHQYGTAGATRLNALRYALYSFFSKMAGPDLTPAGPPANYAGVVTFGNGMSNSYAGHSNVGCGIGTTRNGPNFEVDTGASNNFYPGCLGDMAAAAAPSGIPGYQTDPNFSNSMDGDFPQALVFGASDFRASQYGGDISNDRHVHIMVVIVDAPLTAGHDSDVNTVCSRIKAGGNYGNSNPIVLYTVAFGPDVQSDDHTKQVLSQCASGSADSSLGQYFFLAPDSVSLSAVMGGIATNVKAIHTTSPRITK